MIPGLGSVTGTGMCLGARVSSLHFNVRLNDKLLCLAQGLVFHDPGRCLLPFQAQPLQPPLVLALVRSGVSAGLRALGTVVRAALALGGRLSVPSSEAYTSVIRNPAPVDPCNLNPSHYGTDCTGNELH